MYSLLRILIKNNLYLGVLKMLNDIVLETFCVLFSSCVLLYLLIRLYGTKQIRKIDGWYYIITGFILFFFGMVMDVTDNFEGLNRYVVIGNTKYEAVLEKIVGYLGGFLFLAVGFSKWLSNNLQHNNKINNELDEAVKKLTTINNILPICSSCKKICDDNGNWTQIETYMNQHAEARFSHAMCPSCAETRYPDVDFSGLEAEKTKIH